MLVGAGTAFTEEEKAKLADELDQHSRQMVYLEFAYENGEISYNRLHVVAPNKKGVFWWDDCTSWAATTTSEVMLVPLTEGARGHFVNRKGALKYVGSRPTITHDGVTIAGMRLAGIVERPQLPDYEGQKRDDLPSGGVRVWQTRGFKIREEGRVFSPEQAAAMHRFRSKYDG